MNRAAIEALGIDWEEGLAYCAEDEEFYGEMLRAFVDESRSRADGMRRALDGADWEHYGLCAHSLKNTSRMIGAAGLARGALALEQAARAQDGAAVAGRHAGFLAECAALADGLEEALREG